MEVNTSAAALFRPERKSLVIEAELGRMNFRSSLYQCIVINIRGSSLLPLVSKLDIVLTAILDERNVRHSRTHVSNVWTKSRLLPLITVRAVRRPAVVHKGTNCTCR